MPYIGRQACLFDLSCCGGDKARNVAGRDVMGALMQGQVARDGSAVATISYTGRHARSHFPPSRSSRIKVRQQKKTRKKTE